MSKRKRQHNGRWKKVVVLVLFFFLGTRIATKLKQLEKQSIAYFLVINLDIIFASMRIKCKYQIMNKKENTNFKSYTSLL